MDLMDEIWTLTVKRDEIAQIDQELLSLLKKRVAAGKVIGEIKRKNGKPLYVPEVEKGKIELLSAQCVEYPGLVEAIWPVIMCYTRSME